VPIQKSGGQQRRTISSKLNDRFFDRVSFCSPSAGVVVRPALARLAASPFPACFLLSQPPPALSFVCPPRVSRTARLACPQGGSLPHRVIVVADSHTLTEDCRAMDVAAMFSNRISLVLACREFPM
jgi:hypothetical protein